MLVYVAGPYSKGDQLLNIRQAILAANEVLEKGYYVFIPHLTHFWHMITPKEYDKWLEIDTAILERCDIIYRIPGESVGADLEVALAKNLGKLIVYNLGDLP
jgi:hypothetical protein